MGSGEHPTWQYIFPIIGLTAFFWEPSFIRDFWLFLGGGWTMLIVAWHAGWRKTAPHSPANPSQQG